MKKVLTIGASVLFFLLLAVSCGNSNSGKKVEDRARIESENSRIRALAVRVARLDSTITEYNRTVKDDLHMELYVLDSCYLKMFHGEKFEEKFNEVLEQVKEKEVAVNTFIRATMINLQE